MIRKQLDIVINIKLDEVYLIFTLSGSLLLDHVSTELHPVLLKEDTFIKMGVPRGRTQNLVIYTYLKLYQWSGHIVKIFEFNFS
jgi:hypothetical protein